MPAGCIEVELTENVLQTGRHTTEALAMLRELGVGVALDDFGTGYSSLVSLQQLPLTRVKLDRSLIATIDTSARSQAITRAIISLCQSLGLEVTAEGVERQRSAGLVARLSRDAPAGLPAVPAGARGGPAHGAQRDACADGRAAADFPARRMPCRSRGCAGPASATCADLPRALNCAQGVPRIVTSMRGDGPTSTPSDAPVSSTLNERSGVGPEFGRTGT